MMMANFFGSSQTKKQKDNTTDKNTTDKTTKKPKETVTITTIKKWDFVADFHIEDDGEYVTSITCKICSEHIAPIRQEAKRRNMGPTILKGIMSYVDGVTYIHKTNISRHVSSGSLHDWAKRTYNPGTVTPTPPPPATQNIQSLLQKSSEALFKNHFTTALSLVMMEGSFADFPKLIEMQKKNGVKFVSGKDSDVRCQEFAGYLAKAMCQDLSSILKSANFFSVEQDGTESRKTREEKEMIYVKVCVRGKPVEIFVKCQRMTDFGGTDADSLKKSIDSAILEYIGEDKYKTGLVSACADGASVNLGIKNGALTQMKTLRPWLLIIHCSAHRIELAVKDAFSETSHFAKIDDMLLGLFLFFKNSGKCWRLLLILAERLGVLLIKIPKSAGTRFQVHKYRAIKALTVNYLPLTLFTENMIESSNKICKPDQKAKCRGYHNQLVDYGFLGALHLYRKTLKETAHMSYVAQNGTALISDIIGALDSTINTLEEIKNEESDELPFPTTQKEDGSITITAEATNLPATTRFKEANKLTDKQRKHAEKMVIISTREEFTLKHAERGKESVNKIKDTLIPAISTHLQKRLDTFKDPVFEAFNIVDHTQWDTSNPEYGKTELKTVSEHFSESLSVHKYSLDMANYEWRELKKLVSSKFPHFSNSIALWQQIFAHHHKDFPHILLVVELVLCVAYSSATVERGISTLNRQLTSLRTSMQNSTLNDLLQLRINLPTLISLDSAYEGKLIEKAVKLYTEDKNRRKGFLKRRATESVQDLHSSEDHEDTFLPTPSTSVIRDVNNELMIDEDFLAGDTGSDECGETGTESCSESETESDSNIDNA